jgi:selenocysteine lyase/cysteine desulfurase
MADVSNRLRSDNLVVGARGGRLRVSIAPYNDEEDMTALVASLSRD